MKNKEKVVALTKPYQASDIERAAMEATQARRIKTPRIKITPTGPAAGCLSPDHPEQRHGWALLMNAMGTGEPAFIDDLMIQLARASSDATQSTEQNGQKVAGPNERKLNFLAAVIKSIKPQDEIESMLAAQMATVHCLTMEFATKLALEGDLIWRDSAERTVNRLARTFTTQVEALKRYRTGGAQTVRVEHVTINSGGQAIVGNVSGGMGPEQKKEPTS
jgi:hypothetical protein